MKYKTEQVFETALNGLEASLRRAEGWRELPPELLDPKPAPGKWSANECMGHLLLANGHYLEQLKKLKASGKLHRGAPKPEFKPGWLGGYLRRLMELNDGEVKSKMKAPGILDPSKKTKTPSNGPEVLEKFISQTRELIDEIEEGRKANLGKVRVASVIGSILTMKLGDVYLFLDAHTRRHLHQAERAIHKAKESVPA